MDALTRTLGGWGIGDGVQVVAYDDAGGAFAGRLWWTLQWLGHEAVAVRLLAAGADPTAREVFIDPSSGEGNTALHNNAAKA